MSVGDLAPPPAPPPSFQYKLLRGIVRLWVKLFFRKVRFINPDALAEDHPAMLLVGHPASFLDAVILITAFERHVQCFMDVQFLGGFWRATFARLLDIIPFEAEGEPLKEAMEQASEALERGEMLLVFAKEQIAKTGARTPLFATPAQIALQSEIQNGGQLGLEVYPVHLFLPVAQLFSSELLIYLDTPLIPAEYLARGGTLEDHVEALAAAAEESCRQNVHRLQPETVREFLTDLEEILRADLAADFAKRPNWKQKADGFSLSQFVANWVEELNGLHPGQLVALRDLMESYREAARTCAFGQLEIEEGGEWLKSAGLRAACWAASIIGLPIALYGAINHLIAGLILQRAGLLESREGQNPALRWAVRVLVVLGCYALQTLLCAFWLGRTVTGYYAPSLPLSGVFLLGYAWLLRHLTSFLLLHFRTHRLEAKLAPMRKALVHELNTARDAYSEMLGLPH